MRDSADGTVTGLKPGTIQLDSVLTVSCSTGQAGNIILTFGGELDAVSADRAYRYMHDAIDTCGVPVMLDVAALSYCDARGLGALVRMSSHARQAGSSLHLLRPPSRLVKLLRITGLDQELPVHREEPTEEVALARVRRILGDGDAGAGASADVLGKPGVIVQAAAGAGPVTLASRTGDPTPRLPVPLQYVQERLPQGLALPQRGRTMPLVDVFLARCGSSSPCCDAGTVPQGDTGRMLRR